MHSNVKNSFYLTLIYLNLVNHFHRLSANSINKSLHNKCSLSLSSVDYSEYDLSKIPDNLFKELALNYSLKLFGLKRTDLMWKRRRRHNFAPQYMLDLYSSVSNNTINSNLKYNSKTIRSVAHSDTSVTKTRLHFYFNLSQLITREELIIEAEFHIYKLKSEAKNLERREDPKHNLLEVNVYQLLSEDHTNGRLLDVRRMSTHSYGWDVFYVKSAVIDWLRNDSTNYGLSIIVKSLRNEDMEKGIRFANRYQNHMNKQPMIVIFSDDNKNTNRQEALTKPNANSKYDYGFSELDNNNREDIESKESSDKGMSSHLTSYSYASNVCLKRQIYIDFERFGWTASILFPKGLTITLCEDECTNRVNQNNFAKSETTLPNSGLLHHFYSSVKRCCIANTFSPLNVLYFDERGNVVLKRIDDLIVHNCLCLPCNPCH